MSVRFGVALAAFASAIGGCSSEHKAARAPDEPGPQAATPVRVAALPSAIPAPPPATASDGGASAKETATTDRAPEESPQARATGRCIATGKLSACLPLFGQKKMDDFDSPEVQAGAACTRGCIEARPDRLRLVIESAVGTCREAYEKSRGKAAVRCVFPKGKAPADAREHSMRFQDALRAALEKPSDATAQALDAMLPVLDSGHYGELEPDCTKRCRTEGAAALAATTGP